MTTRSNWAGETLVLSTLLVLVLACLLVLVTLKWPPGEPSVGCPTCGRPRLEVDEDEEIYWRGRMANEWTKSAVITLDDGAASGKEDVTNDE